MVVCKDNHFCRCDLERYSLFWVGVTCEESLKPLGAELDTLVSAFLALSETGRVDLVDLLDLLGPQGGGHIIEII